MLSFMLACCINTNFCDSLDVAGDSQENVPTIPVMFGIKNTYTYGMLVPSLLFLGVSIYSIIAGWITFPFLLFLLLNLFYPLFYISLRHLKNYPRLIIVPVTDLSCLGFPAGLFALYVAGF